mmetsp:Transcript_27236/g.88986  ORF Transcript_27236/g.88986 Transcript_27236/m.88986 type:complete len:83 (-) Transcript_27236:1252-1500(-)
MYTSDFKVMQKFAKSIFSAKLYVVSKQSARDGLLSLLSILFCEFLKFLKIIQTDRRFAARKCFLKISVGNWRSNQLVCKVAT